MLKLVNGKRIDYHSALIANATEDDREFFSGSAKAYTAKRKLTWSGDFLFKHASNLDINPHVGHISFCSDHDITVDEYGNIEVLHSDYPFFATYSHNKLSKYSDELSDNQYSKIGQKSLECETIKFIDTSVFINNVEVPPIYTSKTATYPIGVVPVHRYTYQHSSGYAPICRAHGYSFPFNPTNPLIIPESFMWIRQKDSSMGAPVWWNSESKNRLVINNDLFYVDFLDDEDDISTADSYMLAVIPANNGRVFSFFPQDNKKRRYFDKLNKWNIYLRDDTSFVAGRYVTDIGVVELYDSLGVTIQPIHNFAFYPDITIDGVYEPAKCLVDWGSLVVPYRPSNDDGRAETGSAFINFGICNEDEPDDQSRLLFQTCKHMYSADTIDGLSQEILTILGTTKIEGLDLETERQRRYSSVVTTQPYQVVQPIANSEVVEYLFVDKDGTPVTTGSITAKPDIFLRVKSSAAMVTALDDTLKLEEYNNDIINVFEISDPESADLATDAATYFDFDGAAFFTRQDYSIDDFLLIIASYRRPKFWITPAGSKIAEYGSEMLVNGLGFYSTPNFDSNGLYDGTVTRKLKMYCSNFIFSYPDLQSKQFVNASMATAVEHGNERFRPIVKLPGVNGYVKIIERARQFEPSRSADGKYVNTYVVEFPYCPGSWSERLVMDFSAAGEDVYRQTFIQYKKDYLFAGSHALDSNSKYDNYNERKLFSFQDLQSPMASYVNMFVDPITHTQQHGGDEIGYVGDLSTVERRRRTMRYPSNLVFQRFDPELFLLRLYGDNASFKTNNLRIIQSYSPVSNDVDMKFILLPSSKMWKYDNSKYSSYINHENPSFVFEMDASSVFEDYTLHQEAHQLLPDLKRWLYGYAKTMASTTLSSSGTQLPYSNSDLSVNQIESNILIEVWDSQAQIFTETIPNWRPISMSLFDDGKLPGSVILDKLAVYAGPSYHGDYVSYVFEKLDMTNGIFNFAGAGYSDVLGFVGLTNKALYDMENGRVYHVVNTASEDGGARLRIYFKYDPINDPALQLYNPVQGAVGQISIHEPLKFISRSKENEIYTSEASTIESDGIQKRMIDVRNTVADSSGLTDLMRYVDSDNKISFRVHVLRDRDYPKAFYTKSADIFQYTNFNAVVPTPADINPWISGATAWDWSLVGLTEDVKYVGMSYFQLLSK